MSCEDPNEKVTFTFIWKIENFSHCLQTRGECLESLDFWVSPILWKLWVYPKGKEDDEQINFFLSSEDRIQFGMFSDEFTFDFQLSPLAADGSIISSNANRWDIQFERLLHSITEDKYYQKDVYETKRSVYLPNDTLTLFCRVWKISRDHSDVRFFARTRLGFQKMSKLWNIQDFIALKTGDRRDTNVSTDALQENDIHLKVSLEQKGCETYLKILIKRKNITRKMLLSCTISVLNQYKKPFKNIRDERMCLPEQKLSWIFPTFISKRELIEQKSDLLPQDELSLKFDFTISSGVEYEKIESVHFGPMPNLSEDSIGAWGNPLQSEQHCPPSAKNNLKTDLLSLYQEHTLSDFELRSEGIVFPVHKSILCARSPVFKAMLTSDMEEVTTNCLKVTDIDSDIMTRLLYYIYTDTVEDLDLDSASKLFYASDKYEILSLKQKCSSALESHLAVDNVSDILLLADKHQDDQLKSAVYHFIANYDKEIMQSVEWVEFDKTHSNLAAKTMYEAYKKKLQIK